MNHSHRSTEARCGCDHHENLMSSVSRNASLRKPCSAPIETGVAPEVEKIWAKHGATRCNTVQHGATIGVVLHGCCTGRSGQVRLGL